MKKIIKKLKQKKLGKKSWFCDVIKVAIGYHGNYKKKKLCVIFMPCIV